MPYPFKIGFYMKYFSKTGSLKLFDFNDINLSTNIVIIAHNKIGYNCNHVSDKLLHTNASTMIYS